MKQPFLPYLLAAAGALAGCETVVAVDPPPHTPRLALAYTLSNRPATAGYQQFFNSRALYVSTSQGVLETKPLRGRADAAVELRDAAGQVVERFRPQGRAGYGGQDSLQGYYVPTRGYAGQPGALHAAGQRPRRGSRGSHADPAGPGRRRGGQLRAEAPGPEHLAQRV